MTRNALVGGRRGGMLTMAGGTLGVAVHGAVAAVGLSALLVASAEAFTVVKMLGARYLAWLGVHMIRDALTRNRTSVEAGLVEAPSQRLGTCGKASSRTRSTPRSRCSS